MNCGMKIEPAKTAKITNKPLIVSQSQDNFRRGLAGCLSLLSSRLDGLAGITNGMAILGRSAPQK
jgi:hypothetical protein